MMANLREWDTMGRKLPSCSKASLWWIVAFVCSSGRQMLGLWGSGCFTKVVSTLLELKVRLQEVDGLFLKESNGWCWISRVMFEKLTWP
jgi:hypothetical protein